MKAHGNVPGGLGVRPQSSVSTSDQVSANMDAEAAMSAGYFEGGSHFEDAMYYSECGN